MSRGVHKIRSFRDIGGVRSGRLLAIGRVGFDKWGRPIWLCKCDCGNFARVMADRISLGYTKSCGCLQKERAREAGQRRKGEDCHNWVGEFATYSAVHKWLQRNKPKPEFCERCGERPATQVSYEGKVGWSRNPNDYEWLCRSCHQLKDRGKGTIMTKKKISEIRGLYAAGTHRQYELAEIFGVDRAVISRIINHKGLYSTV